ncbi:RNA-binding transcriptional accessory protein [Nitrincola tibetensis]|uniref:RNA-binding transcriptional accessory protein n=1 Tax=Nitrincola tibetensis TaxID=2219697 RepID=A0A364NID9_9GAMM|nr:Tex family protein [Nitrincola tibetensis]RAU16889.1 RNA-binding transcriptional accessory protein [Nitrincola tibetensis]
MQIELKLAKELDIGQHQVSATLSLLDQGATIPFIARYRKEATGGLDDTQLRDLHQRLLYLRDLDQRRKVIIEQITEQGLLTRDLEQALQSADTKSRLEDLYLPFRPKRRNKAQEAREAGLAPLSQTILQHFQDDPKDFAPAFMTSTPPFDTLDGVLENTKHILLETLTEQADALGHLRLQLWKKGVLKVQVVKGKAQEDSKYRDYFEYEEAIVKIPSHRALALLRGHNEGVLKYTLNLPDGMLDAPYFTLAQAVKVQYANSHPWLKKVIEEAWSKRLRPQLETELVKQMRENADAVAIDVFAKNLKDLLLAAPAGAKATLGLDPGLRTGTKLAVVSATGQLLAHDTIYPHAPHHKEAQALDTLTRLIKKHDVELIAIGNGTASRETQALVSQLQTTIGKSAPAAVLVSEAGASVYSASAFAAAEFPDLDVSIRGAVSIARRLQDPLAELVKIDPQSIGVGQYQHDIDQKALASKLDDVVEDCVNYVGVDLNMASEALLSRVAGLNSTLANNIVAWRNESGRFNQRKQLLKVPRLGPKAFEQCAGFLRIRNGLEPLDNSAVHPESYDLVAEIARCVGMTVPELLNQPSALRTLTQRQIDQLSKARFTLTDILKELEKPGRDPRPEFQSVQYDQRVQTLQDLQEGMRLEGVITNVTPFGAFVDVGVHQDGLVHISQLADRFVSDPHSVVQTGQIVQVRVLEVDTHRKRIALSMKSIN